LLPKLIEQTVQCLSVRVECEVSYI